MDNLLERRVERLEAEQDQLGKSLNQLNTTLALLNQTVVTMAANEEKKKQMIKSIQAQQAQQHTHPSQLKIVLLTYLDVG